ncbi:MAG: ribonuclease P protein component, partial [Pseudomonadota bacterium]|nr:ribonuclease P protein component [Pseudomonadota bacterium]
LAVSRKVDPHAVGRNRIKRALREQFRALRAQLAHGDYVCVARAPAAQADGCALRATLVSVLQRAGALPPPDATGTMPGATENDALLSPSTPSHTSKPAFDAG